MQPSDALLPTVPQQVVALPPPPPPPLRRGPGLLVIVSAVTLIVGLAIGIGIGRVSPAVVPPPPKVALLEVGHLDVSSKPVDGNVIVDGRFVGVAPIDRVDLDPGKHSIVIDAFGYQPYAGTLDIDPRGQINLRVRLAPIGGDASTSGNVTGAGKATTAAIPATALLPAVTAPHPPAPPTEAAHASHVAAQPPPSQPPPPAPAPPPPERPRRDCNGEKSRCRDGCSRSSTDCNFSCPTCTSCMSSMGQDECRRQCDSCRSGCTQNTKFCESTCDNQYETCNYSSQ